MAKKLVSVSSVEPVYNKKGTKVIGWKVSAKYIVMTSMEWPSTLCFYSTKVQEYSFCNLFGLGYTLAQKVRDRKLAKLALQNSEVRR